jgi:NAD(P)-dependent dehydrogenase (short-subunit alcohol dehydrogenase family)
MINPRPLKGKVAIVTGSGNGIGRAIAHAMVEAGAKVLVSDILAEDGQRTVKEIREQGGEAAFVATDVSQENDVRNMVESAARTFGSIDILVNNAGGGGGGIPGRAHETEISDFDKVIGVNLRSTFLCAKFVIPHFLKKGGGCILNIASTYGLIAAPNAPAYCAAKGGIINLTRQLALDYGPDHIRVNAICPGYIDTGLRSRRASLDEAELAAAIGRREKAAAIQPLGRQGKPGEIADVAIFLCSDAASFMTGSIVTVDGGCVTTFNYGEASN